MATVEEQEESIEQLACRAQAGCLDSYERIVHMLQARVFNFVLRMTANEQDAEDVVQEAFVKAWRNLRAYDGRSKFTTWLYAIAKNTALNKLRSRRPHEPLDEHSQLPAPDVSGDGSHSVWTLARTLKPKFFEALFLHYAEGFSMEEIAEITGSNSISVRVTLHRARAALKKKYRIYESL